MAVGEPGQDGGAIELARPTAAPPQVRAAAKARLLAASLGASNPTPERERIAGRYRLVREIGRGGIGSVWEAELTPIGKHVAIKLLRRESIARSGDHEARLLREAQAASAIGHDHIVRVDDFGNDPDSGPFLVMELLRGRALAAEIAIHAPMPWPRVAGILLQLCSALAAAHAVGIVHRDLKPANVFLVEREGGADHCKLLDFGLCKPAPELADALTNTGARLGTPGYMAPEQIRGDTVDGRADLYALGCVAYEMLCGRPPFRSRRLAELIEAHLFDAVPPLGERVAPEVAAIVTRALAKDPGDRFADADAMARAIRATGIAAMSRDRTVPAPTRTRSATSLPRLPTRSRAWMSTVVLAGGVLGFVGVLAMRDEPTIVRDEPTIVRDEPEPSLRMPAPARERAPAVAPAPARAPSRDVATPPQRTAPRRITKRRAPPEPVVAPPPPDPPATPPTPPTLVDGIRDPFGS